LFGAVKVPLADNRSIVLSNVDCDGTRFTLDAFLPPSILTGVVLVFVLVLVLVFVSTLLLVLVAGTGFTGSGFVLDTCTVLLELFELFEVTNGASSEATSKEFTDSDFEDCLPK